MFTKKIAFYLQVENQEHIIKTKVSWSKLNDKIVGTYGAERIHIFKMFEKFPLPNEKKELAWQHHKRLVL